MAVVPVDQCRVIVLHSALGLTRGVREFAELLRAQGCEVSVPDYYEGRTFTTTDEGVAHRDAVGYRQLFARVRDLDVDGAVLVGFSLGASFVQRLARPGVRLAVLVGSLDPLREEWPGVDVQLHRLAGDAWVDEELVGPFGAAVAASGATFEDVVSPGGGHLFTEPDLPEHDAALTALTVERILAHVRTEPPEEAVDLAHALFDLARQGEADRLAAYVDAGAPVDLTDPAGNTLLMLAAYHGHALTVRALAGRGADVDRLNDRGQSPLAGAVFKGEDEVVSVLREHGADPDAGRPTARETAQMFGREDLIP
jgi:hypothetical protein